MARADGLLGATERLRRLFVGNEQRSRVGAWGITKDAEDGHGEVLLLAAGCPPPPDVFVQIRQFMARLGFRQRFAVSLGGHQREAFLDG